MATKKAESPLAVGRIEGSLIVPSGARFALVAGRFNSLIVEQLVAGARDALVRHGADGAKIIEVYVPGAWEIPIACDRIAHSGKVDAIVALGAVIRGGTPHFEYVAGEVAKGTASVALETGVPVSLGVLTTDTIEQAIERAGTKAGNKGADAAMAAVEMVNLAKALTDAGL
jgi:6,7-dimethyl-8-ribityllumazine synthase